MSVQNLISRFEVEKPLETTKPKPAPKQLKKRAIFSPAPDLGGSIHESSPDVVIPPSLPVSNILRRRDKDEIQKLEDLLSRKSTNSGSLSLEGSEGTAKSSRFGDIFGVPNNSLATHLSPKSNASEPVKDDVKSDDVKIHKGKSQEDLQGGKEEQKKEETGHSVTHKRESTDIEEMREDRYDTNVKPPAAEWGPCIVEKQEENKEGETKVGPGCQSKSQIKQENENGLGQIMAAKGPPTQKVPIFMSLTRPPLSTSTTDGSVKASKDASFISATSSKSTSQTTSHSPPSTPMTKRTDFDAADIFDIVDSPLTPATPYQHLFGSPGTPSYNFSAEEQPFMTSSEESGCKSTTWSYPSTKNVSSSTTNVNKVEDTIITPNSPGKLSKEPKAKWFRSSGFRPTRSSRSVISPQDAKPLCLGPNEIQRLKRRDTSHNKLSSVVSLFKRTPSQRRVSVDMLMFPHLEGHKTQQNSVFSDKPGKIPHSYRKLAPGGDAMTKEGFVVVHPRRKSNTERIREHTNEHIVKDSEHQFVAPVPAAESNRHSNWIEDHVSTTNSSGDGKVDVGVQAASMRSLSSPVQLDEDAQLKNNFT